MGDMGHQSTIRPQERSIRIEQLDQRASFSGNSASVEREAMDLVRGNAGPKYTLESYEGKEGRSFVYGDLLKK